MANAEQLALLTERGVEAWNAWRILEPPHGPDYPLLRDVDLTGADLTGLSLPNVDFRFADLSFAKLVGANAPGALLQQGNLHGANLQDAHLPNASLERANLTGANLRGTCLRGANLSEDMLWVYPSRYRLYAADLTGADLTNADLTGANLESADLQHCHLVGTILEGCNLRAAKVYGISVWDVRGKPEHQTNILVTPVGSDPVLQVDNLRVAQFVYLMLDNAQLGGMIDTVTSKGVLILGRFSEERKAVLDAIRDALRRRGYTPMLFDFEKPRRRDLTETVTLLARLSRFIIADITDPSSVPHELRSIVPDLPSVPVVPLLWASAPDAYSMFPDLQRRCHWVLPIYRYESRDQLIATLDDAVISAAESKRSQQMQA